MSDVVVYGIPGSPFMRAVQVGLEEKKATYRIAVVAPGESKRAMSCSRRTPRTFTPTWTAAGCFPSPTMSAR
jgi:hypothetical protein